MNNDNDQEPEKYTVLAPLLTGIFFIPAWGLMLCIYFYFFRN
jgi:hypothetical protein